MSRAVGSTDAVRSASRADPVRPVERANAVTRLLVAIAFAAVLVISVDPVSAAVALIAGVVLLPAAALPPAAVLRRMTPVLIAAPLAGLTIALYGAPAGRVLLIAGPIRVTEGSLFLALAALLRILAIGLWAIGLLGGLDATALADGLAQRLHLPARFVLGALAALRLFGLLGRDWQALGLARRARGVADRGRIRRAAGQSFGLLVLSVRRGTVLATAMEARGFGAGPRTWARPSRFGAADAVLAAVVAVVLAAAIIAAVATGAWNPGGGRG